VRHAGDTPYSATDNVSLLTCPPIALCAANPMPTMPEESTFGESTSFLGGAVSSSEYVSSAAIPAVTATYEPHTTGDSLSPVARQDSFTAASGRTGGYSPCTTLRELLQ
jgi:hypothetical protein